MSALTYAEALRVTAQALADAGIDEARLEARLLLQWASGKSRAALIADEHAPIPAAHAAALSAALAHRAARRPLAHLEGVAHFYGLVLRSDARALIPRADSECVVDLALAALPADRPVILADLGTGTGALLAALLSQRPAATGHAVELSPDAAALAAENFAALGLAPRVTLHQGAWADWTAWAACDLIISNPPYIDTAIIDTLEPEVRDHDPRLALDGGADGLDAYREIIALASARMKPRARLVLEIGHDQRARVSALLEQHGFTALTHAQDLGGHDRAIAATAR